MTIQAGQYVTDGTAVFIIDDVRDGFRVGDIVFRPTLHNGFVKANGAQGRVLQGTTDNVKEIGAGLPNITGSVSSGEWINAGSKYNFIFENPEATGAFCKGDGPASKAFEGGASLGAYPLGFDASRSNKIYGASATVQPPALALIPQIKY